jgi:hypothetical protein
MHEGRPSALAKKEPAVRRFPVISVDPPWVARSEVELAIVAAHKLAIANWQKTGSGRSNSTGRMTAVTGS